MFGYLPGLSACCQKAATTYRAHFCGLGTGLHRHYGMWGRGLVNRDSTFLTLLGSSLSEPEPVFSRLACCNPLATPRPMLVDGPLLQYTAAVTVCGLMAKLDDDAQDERGWRGWVARSAGLLTDSASVQALGVLHAQRFPVAEVRAQLARQTLVEAGERSLAACAEPTATAYGHITAHLASVMGVPAAEPGLRQLGNRLGFLIYAHDAWVDFERDERRGSFNPLRPLRDLASRRAALVPLLRDAVASLGTALHALPLRRNRDLLQAVLVDGAQQRVEQVEGERPKKPRRDRSSCTQNRWWDCCDCPVDCCRCPRSCASPKAGKGDSCCDCNPCDGDGCECCGCDCGCSS